MGNYKKTILTTILWTLTTLVLLCAVVVFIMIFAFPKTLGNFFHSLGNNHLASAMYAREYENSGDLLYCYKSLSIEIVEGNNTKIVELYETFESDNEYENFMSQLKTRNENLNIGILEKSAVLNEDDYLQNRYIKALINQNETRKAYDKALKGFKDYKQFDLKNQGVYALNYFVKIDGFNDFEITPVGFDGTLIDAMEEYFDICVNLFEENRGTDDGLEKAYLISLGNRIVQVGSNINAIISDNGKIESNNADMLKINDYVKGFL